ncbi:MAG: ABC transporter permease [Thermoplasmata archaeon]
MNPRHRLRSVLWLTYLNGVLPMRSQPLYLINLLASPLSFLFFVTVASNGALFQYGVSGGMLLTVLSIGTSLQSDMTHYRHDLKLQDVMVASPLEAPVYVAGLALSELVYSLPGMALFVALWIVHTPPSGADIATVIGTLLLVWAFASALGFTLATYFEDVRETFVFAPLISLIMTVLPPVYYPPSSLPGWALHLAYLSPTTYAADLLHYAFGLQTIPGLDPLVDWAVLIAFTVGLLLLATFKARWREP